MTLLLTLTSHLQSAVKSNLFSLPSKHLKELTLKKKNDILKTNKMTDDILKVINDRNLSLFIIDARKNKVTPLLNVVTGVVLGHPKSEKLLNAKQIGQDELKNWFQSRVVGESDFWATLLNVETFASLTGVNWSSSKSVLKFRSVICT